MLTGVVVFAIPAALTWRVEAEAWPFIAASAALELAYFALLAATYSRADYSFAYPVARGSAPILVLLISTIALGAEISAARDRRHPRGDGRGAARARRRHRGRRQDEPAVRARRGRVHRGLHARRRPRRGARGADPVLRDRPAALRDPVRARRRPRSGCARPSTAARSPPAWAWPAPTSSCWPRSNARPPRPWPRSGRRASCSPASGEDGGGSRARRSSSRASPRSSSARDRLERELAGEAGDRVVDPRVVVRAPVRDERHEALAVRRDQLLRRRPRRRASTASPSSRPAARSTSSCVPHPRRLDRTPVRDHLGIERLALRGLDEQPRGADGEVDVRRRRRCPR